MYPERAIRALSLAKGGGLKRLQRLKGKSGLKSISVLKQLACHAVLICQGPAEALTGRARYKYNKWDRLKANRV
jgi:hypothetical protein